MKTLGRRCICTDAGTDTDLMRLLLTKVLEGAAHSSSKSCQIADLQNISELQCRMLCTNESLPLFSFTN